MNRRRFDVSDAVALAYRGWSNVEIAREFGVDEASIRRALRSASFERKLIPQEAIKGFTLDTPLVIEEEPVLITADWHIPLFDIDYVNTMLLDAEGRGVTKLVIGGDFFNFDSLSQYDPKQTEAGLEYELETAQNVMRILGHNFDKIYYLWGNHDARLHKALGFKLQFQTAMRTVFDAVGDTVLDKIEFSNLDHMHVVSGGQEWYVCHPMNYTRVPLSTARAIAAKVGANVIVAHSHHSAVGYATDGVTVVAEAGGLFDVSKTRYLQRTTTFPTWTQGYAFLEEGHLTVKSPGWSTE
jgi:hypothetical protein